MLRKLFGASALSEAAESLYTNAVAAARNEVFYAEYGVPDTVDGRFEMISLHVYVLLRRLKSLGAEGKKLSQNLFDTMFDDMDRTLREMGAGDLGVGRLLGRAREQRPLRARDALLVLHDVHRQADRPRLVGEGALDALFDPPRGV